MTAEENTLVTQLTAYEAASVFHYTYIYNPRGDVVVETKYKQLSSSSDLQNQQLTVWEYQDNVCVRRIEKHWNVDDWTDDNVVEYVYSGDKLIKEHYFDYRYGNAELVRVVEYQYYANKTLKSKKDSGTGVKKTVSDFIYNHKSNLTEQHIRNEQNAMRLLYSYDDNDNLLSLLYKVKTGDAWTDSLRTAFYYKNGKMMMQKTQQFIDNSKWENLQRIVYEYKAENGKIETETYQYWHQQFWKDELKYTYKYNDKGYFLEKAMYVPLYAKWRRSMAIMYDKFKYDKGTEISSQYDFWGGEDGAFVRSSIIYEFNDEVRILDAEKIILSYQPIGNDNNNPTHNDSIKKNTIVIYPNPSEGIYYFNNRIYDVEHWFITDLNGKIMKKYNNSSKSGVIDLTKLPAGIYIFHAMTGKDILYQKLMKK
jgi:hypothetical protein